MKKYIFILLATMGLSSFALIKPKSVDAPKIKWLTWEEAQVAQKKKPKKILRLNVFILKMLYQ